MLGRQENACNNPFSSDSKTDNLYKRDLFEDMKIGLDCLKELNNKLLTLHPDVLYKIRQIM